MESISSEKSRDYCSRKDTKTIANLPMCHHGPYLLLFFVSAAVLAGVSAELKPAAKEKLFRSRRLADSSGFLALAHRVQKASENLDAFFDLWVQSCRKSVHLLRLLVPPLDAKQVG
jgi:hypothetical protein